MSEPNDVPAEDNPCGHTEYVRWMLCGVCAKAMHENGLRRMREAGERVAMEQNRRWWEAFRKALDVDKAAK
jgi:hypothetical protein